MAQRERDDARAERDSAQHLISGMSYALNRAEQERDKARAERDRLRKLLREARSFTSTHGPLSAAIDAALRETKP
jgi:hypothetical protein